MLLLAVRLLLLISSVSSVSPFVFLLSPCLLLQHSNSVDAALVLLANAVYLRPEFSRGEHGAFTVSSGFAVSSGFRDC